MKATDSLVSLGGTGLGTVCDTGWGYCLGADVWPHTHCLQPGLLCHCALSRTSHPEGTEWLSDGVDVEAGQ